MENTNDNLLAHIKRAVDKYPDKASECRNGRPALLGLFMGEVMISTKGKADPKTAYAMLKTYLGF